MTWRAAVVLLAPLALIAAGSTISGLLAAGLAMFVAGVLVVIIDGRRAPSRRALTVRREHVDILSVGAVNRIVLRVSSPRQCNAVVRDECPEALHPSSTQW